MRYFRGFLNQFLALVLAVSTLSAISVVSAPSARALSNSDCTPTVSGVTASGVASGNDCIITFTSGSGTWTAPTGVTSYKVLVVGGGGGGGADAGGGGGGGGVFEGTIDLSTQANRSFSVTVGAGGLRIWHTAYDTRYPTDSGNPGGTNGGLSKIEITDASSNLLAIQANGGNKGTFGANVACCAAGGAGGSVSLTDNSSSLSYSTITNSTGGTGGTGRNFQSPGNGGDGAGGYNTSSNFSGSFGGGGGGGADIGTGTFTGGAGVNGGGVGGSGTDNVATRLSSPGTTNSGGGGGAGSAHAPTGAITIGGVTDHSRNGAPGGSGVVIVRFTVPTLATPSTPDLDAASDSGVSSTDNTTNDTTPTFSGTATPGSSIQLQRDGVNTGSPCITDASGNWSCTTGVLGHSGGGNNYRAVSTYFGQTATSGSLNVVIRTSGPGSMSVTRSDGATSTVNAGQTLTIRFSAGTSVTGFTIEDVTVTGGSLSNFTVISGRDYSATFTPTPTSTGTASISVGANTFFDLAGFSNTAGTALTIPYNTYGACLPIENISGGYTTLRFTSATTCLWSVPSGVSTAEILVVGGGGGGGAGGYNYVGNVGGGGGGGGGGGSVSTQSLTGLTTNQSLEVTVGVGGAGGSAPGAYGGSWGGSHGRNGSSSSLKVGASTITASGGVAGLGGGSWEYSSSGSTACSNNRTFTVDGIGIYYQDGLGGRGGNSGSNTGARPYCTTGTYGLGQTNAGVGGSGGGGAGSFASATNLTSLVRTLQAGGAGTTSDISGSTVEYGTGGFGGKGNSGSDTPEVGAEGSRSGMGGTGGSGSTSSQTAGTSGAVGGAGASGVVIIRYVSTYTITYSYYGADAGNSTTSATFNPGGSALTLPTPTRTGFSFSGWYTASTGGTLVGLGGASYTPSGTTPAITLHAQWVAPSGTVGVPSAPDSVTATGGNGSIQLTWAAPVSLGGRSISNYQVEYSTTGATNSWTVASSTIANNATTYTITGLTSNTAYYVRIAALFIGGRGAYGYPWQKIYGTVTSTRNGSEITYQTGFGTAAGDAFSRFSSYTRIRYLMKATYGGNNNYVDADFVDVLQNPSSSTTAGFTFDSITNLRIPSTATGQQFIVQGDVYDLTVLAPSTVSVQNGYGFNGRVEIWPWDYGNAPTSGVSSRSSGTYDDGDSTPGSGWYGSFQLHNLTNGSSDYRQTIFAWNNHAGTPEIGFGNNTGTHSDWTFCSTGGTCASRTNFSLEIFVNAPVTASSTPGAPTSVTATSGNNQANISWSAPSSNGGSTITGYTVTSSPSVSAPVGCVNTSNLSCTFTGLTNGTAYTFTVTATNAIGTSSPSSASSAVTPATNPGAPTGVTATAGNAQATVGWTAPASNGGSAVTGYTVTSSPSVSAPVGCVNTANLSCTFTGLSNGTAYTFTVIAINSVGNSTASTASTAVTPKTTPGAPTGVTATAGNSQATVSWSAPASNGGATVTGYSVTSTPLVTAPASCTNTANLSCTFTGLTNGTSYTFTVIAINSVGNSSSSTASSSITPATVPGAPTGATATAGYKQATITWSAPSSNGGSAITGYTVTSSPSVSAPAGCVNTSNLSCTYTGLTAGTAYTFTVISINSVGNSASSTASTSVAPFGDCSVSGVSSGGFTRWTFTSGTPCNWTVPSGVTNVDVLVVAGGAGGNRGVCAVNYGAGGGGGEVYSGSQTLTPGSGITIKVGAGGSKASSNCVNYGATGTNGSPGAASTFDTITVNGGLAPTHTSLQGGASGNGNSGGSIPSSGTSNCGSNVNNCGAGGGGGAGGAGSELNGGAGITSTISGSSKMYGGGGPGKSNSVSGNSGDGLYQAGTAPTANSGGGGSDWTDGAAGIIIVRTANAARTITYALNDGSGSAPTQSSVSEGATFVVASGTGITKNGYTFGGWNDGATTYQSGATYTVGSAAIVLTAVWTPNSLTVTYDSQGGTAVTSGTVNTGASISTAPTSPTRSGYTFSGWSATPSGSIVTFPYAHGQTASFTLYAIWTASALTVTYNSQGGTAVSSGTVNTGASISTAPTAPTRTGYSLSGWSATPTGSVVTFPYAHGQTSNFTLYAIWSANSNTVSFDANGGTGSMSNQSITSGTPTLLTTNSFSRTGFTFGGWNTSADGTGTNYSNSQSVTLTSGLTLFAKWNQIVNGSMSFTGNSNSYLTIPNSSNLKFGTGAFTVEWWQYQTDSSLYPRIFEATKTSARQIGVSIESNTFYWWNSNGAVCRTALGGTAASNKNVWIHFLVARSDSTTRVFKNGVQLCSFADTTDYQPDSALTIGSESARSANTFFGGRITNFHWVKGSALYTTSFASSDSPVIPTPNSTLLLNAENESTFLADLIGSNTVTNNGNNVTWSTMSPFTVKRVIFNANDGSGSPATSSQMITINSATALTSNSFTRTGYTFAGWNTNADGTSGTSYSNGQSVTITSGFTLYAKWTANTLTVTFDSQSGTSVTAGSTTTGASISTAPTAPTRSGYTFSGWATTIGGSVITFPYAHGQTANFTLYAVWTAGSISVAYDSQGGSSVTSGATTSGGSIASAPTAPSRAGYTLSGWSTTSNGSVISFPYSHGQTANFTLYAIWAANALTITYDSNGGSVVSSGNTTTGASISTAPIAPTKNNYTFGGWSATNGGSAITFPYAHGQTSNFTLYAIWTANTYTLTYVYNSATGGNSTVSDSFTTGGTQITLPTPTRTGYTFAGWYLESNFVTQAGLGGASFGPTGSSLTPSVYAKWSAINYSVTYASTNATGGTVPTDSNNYNIGNSVIVKSNTGSLMRTGYSFAGWTVAADGSGTVLNSGNTFTVSTSNITFYPKWNANTYTITYNKNGASGSPTAASATYTTGSTAVTLSTVGTMAKTGFDFGGWSTSPTGSAHSGTYTTTSDVTLYAVWTIKTISINFSKGDASAYSFFNFPSTRSANYGSTITLNDTVDSTVTIGGVSHAFMGWNDGSSVYQSGATYLLGETAPTFTAVWVKVFAVRYAFNGGTAAVGTSAVDVECAQAGSTCTDGQTITANAAPTRPGYTFAGWVDQNNVAVPAGGSFTVSSTRYLIYANWTPIDYSITYDTAGGSAAPTSFTKRIGETFTVASSPTKTGYNFTGWSDGINLLGSGATYYVSTSNVTLTAQWSPKVYTVIYDWNGGSGTPTPDESFTVGGTAITLPTVGDRVKDGFTFSGWSETNNGSLLSGGYTPTGDTTLYAIWGTGSYTLTYNANGGTVGTSSAAVQNGSSLTLPTPTRANFVFDGWHTAASGGTRIGNAGASHQPTQSRTLYARWIQSSIYGISPSALTRFGSATARNAASATFTGTNASSSVSVTVPAGSLPDGTTVNFDLVGDFSRAQSVLSGTNNYVISMVVSWLAPDETVPNTASGKPISVTITNSSIKAGMSVYAIVAGNVTLLGSATQDGTVTVNLTSDPEVVVVATKPGSPTNVSATSNGDKKSVISWTAPSSDGGSSITGYIVTSNTGATCTTSTTSCEVTSLLDGTSYTFTVTATNALGTSSASSSATATTASIYTVTFDSKGGSSVTNGSFLTASTVAEPTAPTRTGYTFAGWSATDGGSVLTFPYSPAVTNNITLYAKWTSLNYVVTFDSKGGTSVIDGSFGSGGTVSEPTAPTRTGYTFAGWSATDGGSAVTFPYAPGVFTDITLYAKWTVVSQNNSGGNGNSGNSNAGGNGNSSSQAGTSAPGRGNVTTVAPITVVGDSSTKVPTVEISAPTTGSEVKPPVVKIDKASEKFIAEVKVVDGKLTLTPETGFSGKKTVTVTISENGEDRIVQIPLTVLPEPVTKPVLTPTASNKTIIRWTQSPNADAYTVYLDGKKICSTQAASCSINRVLGPGADIQIVSNGGDRTVSTKAEADFKQNAPVPITRLVSATNTKGSLSRVDTKALDKIVALIKTQGFGTVVISEISTTSKTKALADARIAAIKKYIDEKTGSEKITFEVVPPTTRTYFNNIAVKG